MQDRQGVTFRRKPLGYATASAAHYRVVLHGDERVMACRQSRKQVDIERFHEAHVDQRSIQSICRDLSGSNHRAEGQDRDTAALTFQLCLADGKCVQR